MQKKDPLGETDRTDTPSFSHRADELSADTQAATSASAKASPPVPGIYSDELEESARSESSLMVQHRNLLQKNPHFFALALFLFVVLCASGAVRNLNVQSRARIHFENQRAMIAVYDNIDAKVAQACDFVAACR